MTTSKKKQRKKSTNMDVNGIVHKMFTQQKKFGLLASTPATNELICNCAINLLHPEIINKDNTNNYTIPDLNGWVIVTTQEKATQWKQTLKRSLECKNSVISKIQLPPYTIHTYDTIGILKLYDLKENNNASKLLIIFEEAEHLIELLRRDRTLKKCIRDRFCKTLLFTSNLEFVDLRELLLLTVHEDTDCEFPATEHMITLRYESTKSSFPRLLKKMVFDPAQKMMMHFLFVFFIVIHMKRLFNTPNKKSLREKYNTALHSKTHTQKQTRQAQNQPKSKKHKSNHREGGQRERHTESRRKTTKNTIHTTHKRQGGIMILPYTLPIVMSGGFLYWLVNKQFSISHVVSELLMFVVMLIPNVLTGVQHFLKRKELRVACINARTKLRRASNTLYNLSQKSFYKTGFTSLWDTTKSLVSGVSQTFFNMKREDSAFTMGFFAFFCFMWLMSVLIHNLYTPLYSKINTTTSQNMLKDDLQDHLYIPYTYQNNVSSLSSSKGSEFTYICKRFVPYEQNDIAELIKQTISYADASTTAVQTNLHYDLTQINIQNKYNSCKKNITKNIKNQTKRILIIVPELDKTKKKKDESWDEYAQNPNTFFELSMQDIKTLQDNNIPTREEKTYRATYPAHEIHFITPPTNHERELVTTLFAGIFEQSTNEVLSITDRIKIVREKDRMYTKLYEYIRRFNWFHWLATPMKPVAQHQATSKHVSNMDWFNYTLSEMKSPEERLREHRTKISTAWKEIYQQLGQNSALTNHVPPVAKSFNDEVGNDFKMKYNTKQKLLCTVYHRNIIQIQKLLKSEAITLYKKTDEELLGEWTINVQELQKKIMDKKEKEKFENLNEPEKMSDLHSRLKNLLDTFSIK